MSDLELFPATKRLEKRWTEREMLDLLASRYRTQAGNGQRYVFSRHVRSHAGFDARRTADFIAMDLWPSKDLALHGHEVKVSRSDWLHELKDPTKAEEFRRYMDRWWLVVPDQRIVRDDLPDGWGLMVARGTSLRVARPAPRLRPEPMPKTMMAAFLRAVSGEYQRTTTPAPHSRGDGQTKEEL